jgi:hypothetical protein
VTIFNSISAQKDKKFSFNQKMKWVFNFKSFLVIDKKTGEYNPYFISNEGDLPGNLFNKGKIKKEARFIEDLKLQKELDKQYSKLKESIEFSKKSGMNSELNGAILELTSELDKLQKNLNELKIGRAHV